jgi:hypothetical protein
MVRVRRTTGKSLAGKRKIGRMRTLAAERKRKTRLAAGSFV